MATRLQDTDPVPANVIHPQQLFSALKTVSNWYMLGFYLGLPKHDLNDIEKDHQESDRRKLEMVDRWLQSTSTGSWEDVVKALCQIGEKRVAERIRQEYIKGGSKCSGGFRGGSFGSYEPPFVFSTHEIRANWISLTS